MSEHEHYRRIRGHSITSLAAAIGRSRIWVSRIENGHERPSASYRRDVARVLGLPEELIFDPPAGNGDGGKERSHEKQRAAPAARRLTTRGAKRTT